MEARREGTLRGGNKCRRATSAGSRGGEEAGGKQRQSSLAEADYFIGPFYGARGR